MRFMPLAGLFLLAAAPLVAAQAQPETPPAAPATPAPAAPAATPAEPPAAPAAPAAPATSGTPAAGQPKAGAVPAASLPKGKPACATRLLPLVIGNTWTYISAPPSVQLDTKELAQLPNQPKKVIITVKDVSTTAGISTVTLEEQSFLDDKTPRVLTTTVTCGPTKFDISYDSFFFAGEPGGSYGLEMTSFERKGTTWGLVRGQVPDAKWREDVVINWKRVGAAGSGKLEMEREFTPEERAEVTTPYAVMRAEPLAISVTGRVFVDGATAGADPYPLKAPMIDRLWLVDGVGVVKAVNSFTHTYVLSEAKLAK
jgi:hypothetical protein